MKSATLLILNILLLLNTSACGTKPEEDAQLMSNPTPKTNKQMSDLSFHIANTQPSYTLGNPITLTVNLTNHTSEVLTTLPWGTPLEQKFNSDMFEVSKDNNSIPYIGRMVKRGQPTDSDYIPIAPAETLIATIDLNQGYAIQTPGQYSVNIKPRYLSTRNGDTKNKLKKVESNSIVIEVTE